MKLARVILITLLLPFIALPSLAVDLAGVDVTRYLSTYETLSPTPKGIGHLPRHGNGDTVRIRYALPKKRPFSYKIDFHNIVAYEGNGRGYHLEIRRDSPQGAVIYNGPTTDAASWNFNNVNQVELASVLTSADFARGYLDLYALPTIQGDTWTFYRDADQGEWNLRATALEDTPALRKALQQNRFLREKQIRLLPMPQQMVPAKVDFRITSKSRILLCANASSDDRFAASLLRDEIRRLSGLSLSIQTGWSGARASDLLLEDRGRDLIRDQAYMLETGGRFKASAGSSSGLFYAVQTAIQLLRKQDGKLILPGLMIQDYPNLPYRMIQYDLARSQTVNMSYLKRMIREMARFKLNQLMLYMENDFKYTQYPFTGRPKTLTPQMARELVAYARQYHVELVPQLEAVGHAHALLSYPQFEDLRENGNPWSFCTSNPRTWQVLDDMIGELASVFDNTPFIHLGGDEFESSFGKCPDCRAQVEKIGLQGLYARHIHHLNELAKKHHRSLMIWTSHELFNKPDDFTRFASVPADKDLSIMEWIYTTPASYPTLSGYQNLGFAHLFVAPATLNYGYPYPDYELGLRTIQGLIRAGIQNGAIGGCDTTWQMEQGSQLETHWYGFLYTAQCCWNIEACDEGAFTRAFTQHWFGLSAERDWQAVRRVMKMESPNRLFWTNLSGSQTYYWILPDELISQLGVQWKPALAAAPSLIAEADRALMEIHRLKQRANRNQVTLDATAGAIRLMRGSARKMVVIDRVRQLTAQGKESECIGELESLRRDEAVVLADLIRVRDERGGTPWDVDNARKQIDATTPLTPQ